MSRLRCCVVSSRDRAWPAISGRRPVRPRPHLLLVSWRRAAGAREHGHGIVLPGGLHSETWQSDNAMRTSELCEVNAYVPGQLRAREQPAQTELHFSLITCTFSSSIFNPPPSTHPSTFTSTSKYTDTSDHLCPSHQTVHLSHHWVSALPTSRPPTPSRPLSLGQ